jgi:hypothetical protein
LTLLSLFTRGRKLVGSRRKVISSEDRNLFIPDNSVCGLQRGSLGFSTRRRVRIGLRSSSRGDGRLSLKYDDPICEICRHDKIVLDDKGSFLRVENESVSFLSQVSCNDQLGSRPFDDFTSDDTLLRIEETKI